MKKTGDLGEELAVAYLERKGYRILKRNWRGVKGMRAPELDIIASDNGVIVFVEVKTSTTNKFGRPQEWITDMKKKRLVQAAEIYLATFDDNPEATRFDAVVVDKSVEPPEIVHIVNAFSISDIS